nr:HEXXH motif-containing putative peptide modification protein [Sphingobium nicotianae]
MRTDVDAPAIALDPFDTLSGECSSSSPTNGDLGTDHDSVYNYLSSIDFFRRAVPEAFDWVTQVARLVAPVGGGAPSSSAFRSASDPETPGLIRLDLGCGLLFTLEALVHESAHNYFYLAEAWGPLVAPDQLHRRFPSPLKAAPRPLRGVMLAYHALAHITALYDALGDVDAFAAQPVLAQQYAELRDAAVYAEATCMAAAGCLTDRGRQFLNDTSNRVFRYARQS